MVSAGSVVTTPATGKRSYFERRLAQHPFRAFLLILALASPCYFLVGYVLYGFLGLPMQFSNMRAFSTVALYTVGAMLAYVLVPYLLRLPCGSRSFRQYLEDIRLTRVRPFVPLLLLTLSCDAILILCQGSGSIVYRLSHGYAITLQSVAQVFDLSAAIPPRSTLVFRQMFSSLEEVAFRGVFLTMLLRRYSERTAIIISAAAFGILHLPSVFVGTPLALALGQVTWAFLFGLFYGYIFIKSGSLLPSMVLHWLSNAFGAPLMASWQIAPVLVRAFYGVVFGYGLAALLSMLWVRFFSARWLPTPNRPADPPIVHDIFASS